MWGSLYVVSRIVLQDMSALWLLFFRFASASLLILLLAKKQKMKFVQKEDWKALCIAGVIGYFCSNACMLLGIQFSSASFSSLINALCPVTITIFAILLLKEKGSKIYFLKLLLSVCGAGIVIGLPEGNITHLGILFCLGSVVLWSFATIYIRKLTAKYSPLVITGTGMGMAACLALPSAILYDTVAGTSLTLRLVTLPSLLYICLFCTALSHVFWNQELSKKGAMHCSSFYPIQPVTSTLLGVLVLHEKISIHFLIGMVIIVGAMMIPDKKEEQPKMCCSNQT
jgi:drug/metabolite transporter (DMT)-like permease